MTVAQRFYFGMFLLVFAAFLFWLNVAGGLILLGIACTGLGLVCLLMTILSSPSSKKKETKP